MFLKLTVCDVNCIELASNSKFKTQYKASLSCLRIFVVHKYSVQLLLNIGDIINNVTSIGAKQFVVSPEMFMYIYSGEAM